MNKIKEDCFEWDLNEYETQYKNNQYDVITKIHTNINFEKISIKMDLAYITKLTCLQNFWMINNGKYKDLSIVT
jgi:hypothetical protein